MLNKFISFGKRNVRRFSRWLINVFIITLVVYIFELIMAGLHVDSWEKFSAKMERADSSILSFSKQVSPVGLYTAYKKNRINNIYGLYFYKWSAPFNLTRACIAMQKRVFQPVKGYKYATQELVSNDSTINDKVPLYYVQNEPWQPTYHKDMGAYSGEPEYLQNACSLDINNPDVIKKNFERTGWEWILAIPDSILSWMSLNWNHEDGDSNWLGRIFLLWSFLFASFASAGAGDGKEKRSLLKKISGFVGRFLLCMIFFGLVALLFGGIIWGVMGFAKQVVHAFSALIAGTSAVVAFMRLFFTEAAEHIGFEGKQKVAEGVKAGFLRGFFKRSK